MGERPDEITVGLDPVGNSKSGTDTSTAAGGDLASDPLYPNEMAGSAYAESMAGLPQSETLSDAAYSEGPIADFEPDTDDDIEAARSQIEQTRSSMSETIDAIQEKLSPANIANQAKDAVYDATVGKAQTVVSSAGDTVSGAGNTVVETIRSNPVPAALVGIGLGWLFTSMRRQSSQSNTDAATRQYASGYGSGYPTTNREYTAYPYRQYAGSGSSTGDAANGVRDRINGGAEQVQGAVSDVVSQAQDSAGQMVNQAQYTALRATTGFQQTLQENPLAVGAGAVVLGLAVGLAIPATPQENQLMGPARDTLAERAQHTVQETAQKVQSVAQEAVGASKQEAQDQNLV